MKSFITVFDGNITGKHFGDISADFSKTEYAEHEKIEVPYEAEIFLDNVNFYDKNWKRKTDIQLIKEKLISLPDGFIIEGDYIREMSNDERIKAGLEKPKQVYIPTAQDKINDLEALITPRRLREAVLGVQESFDFIKDIDDQIKELRTLIQ